jgi:pimeloyl-ACP methyl ester carboxylesterase
VAVIHGGPGAGGEMAPVARELAKTRGVLEPIQTADSLERQTHELKTQLETHASLPAVLVGYSWGAWLAWITAACYPQLVKKLILVSSGCFHPDYLARFDERRTGRLKPAELEEIKELTAALDDPASPDKEKKMARFGAIFARTEAFDPLPDETREEDKIPPRPDIFKNVWADGKKIRQTGRLLKLGKLIRCPVVAIHGDFDPHPAEGVEDPLRVFLKDFKMILLKDCGHTPWLERKAREDFYRELEGQLG